ncbi:MAG: flavin oxidoreductase/NADH oxidase [Bacillota bacterium]|nr:flavin oxidoreductase/NADH oxidase [Bacillota bacterium]
MKINCDYQDLDALRAALAELELDLPLREDLSVLATPLVIGHRRAANRLAVQPMEGCDGTEDGRPGELTIRRYRRFAAGGAGLIWFEATAVREDGRANARQLLLTRETLDSYRELVADIRRSAREAGGPDPLIILQATHSGRYSKPGGIAAPRIAYHHPIFEAEKRLPDSAIMSDGELDDLLPFYGEATRLAAEAGFDGIDIKACHRYLISELLSAFERPGRYGGSFENRTRFLREAIRLANAAAPAGFLVASRINLYDGYPWPCGWGVAPEPAGSVDPDLTEPNRLIRELYDDFGVRLLNLTIGNPYSNPHVNRPFSGGPYDPPEHPLAGIRRHVSCAQALRRAVPEMRTVLSGISWLRSFAPLLAAGVVADDVVDFAGFGRLAFANPSFAREILTDGRIDRRRVCVACSRCSQLMRAGSVAGCPIHDREIYGSIYRRDVLESDRDIAGMVSND